MLAFTYIVMRTVNIFDFSSIMYHLGRLFGLFAILFLSFILFFGDTAKFFDRYFGLDKIIAFNKKFGFVTTLFALSHPIFFILSSKNYWVYLIPNFQVLPLALGTIAFYLLIIFSMASFFYKKVSNQAWQYLHIISYLIFFFGAFHADNIGTDYANSFVHFIHIIMVILVVIGIIYRTTYKIRKKGVYN
ncbi:hypothetical protein BVX95_02035, partial [archaeon D22]